MTQEYPLLIYPEPQTLDRIKRSMPQRSIHFPTPERQAERLSPLFQILKDSLIFQSQSFFFEFLSL